jgi:hypothetical protein
MSISDFDPRNSAVADRTPQAMNNAIGLVLARDFERAQAEVVDLADYINYDDWLDSREGLQIGNSMAGVDAAIVCVSLSSFLEWRGLTGASSDQRALDAFAALSLAMRTSHSPKVLAAVSEFDFAVRPLEVAAFAGGRDYRGWLRRRQAMRAKAAAAGLDVEELPVRLGAFLDWCACLGQSACEAALDRYAELLLEYLTSDPAD